MSTVSQYKEIKKSSPRSKWINYYLFGVKNNNYNNDFQFEYHPRSCGVCWKLAKLTIWHNFNYSLGGIAGLTPETASGKDFTPGETEIIKRLSSYFSSQCPGKIKQSILILRFKTHLIVYQYESSYRFLMQLLCLRISPWYSNVVGLGYQIGSWL